MPYLGVLAECKPQINFYEKSTYALLLLIVFYLFFTVTWVHQSRYYWLQSTHFSASLLQKDCNRGTFWDCELTQLSWCCSDHRHKWREDLKEKRSFKLLFFNEVLPPIVGYDCYWDFSETRHRAVLSLTKSAAFLGNAITKGMKVLSLTPLVSVIERGTDCLHCVCSTKFSIKNIT